MQTKKKAYRQKIKIFFVVRILSKNDLIFNRKISIISRVRRAFYLLTLASFFPLIAKEKEALELKERIPTTIEVRFSYFWPESLKFRDIYYNGGVNYQLTGTVPVYQGDLFALRGVNFWWAVDYFWGGGKSIGLNNKTIIQIEPLTAGLKWIYPVKSIRPYFGLAFKYYFVQVRNQSVYVKKHVADNGLGFVTEVGLQGFFAEHFLLDVFFAYSFKQFGAQSIGSPSAPATWFDIGGINVGGGIGIKF